MTGVDAVPQILKVLKLLRGTSIDTLFILGLDRAFRHHGLGRKLLGVSIVRIYEKKCAECEHEFQVFRK